MYDDIAHDDATITAKLRDFIEEIRELDESSRDLDRRRRDIYSEARNFGFSTDAIKRIARQRHDGEAQSEANDLLSYVEMLGGERATDQMRAGKTFSEVAFGSCGFPSDYADALGDADSALIKGWGEAE
jgi:uncharacterized protein (UPF0335 family)